MFNAGQKPSTLCFDSDKKATDQAHIDTYGTFGFCDGWTKETGASLPVAYDGHYIPVVNEVGVGVGMCLPERNHVKGKNSVTCFTVETGAPAAEGSMIAK